MILFQTIEAWTWTASIHQVFLGKKQLVSVFLTGLKYTCVGSRRKGPALTAGTTFFLHVTNDKSFWVFQRRALTPVCMGRPLRAVPYINVHRHAARCSPFSLILRTDWTGKTDPTFFFNCLINSRVEARFIKHDKKLHFIYLKTIYFPAMLIRLIISYNYTPINKLFIYLSYQYHFTY